jgi:puromycin-sensitive aminopeptidase
VTESVTESESYRLPAHTRPRRYSIELRPDLEQARFAGHVEIDIHIEGEQDLLVLNALELDIDRVVFAPKAPGDPAGREGVEGREVRFSLEASEQQLMLHLDRPARGDARVEIDFRGVLNDQLRGFYRSTYRTPDGSEGVIATTQFESTDARRAFPCWDEPEYKAVFRISVVTEPGLTVISNSPLQSVRTLEGGQVEHRFADTMVMSTYLVAVVVGPFEVTEPVMVDGVPVRVAALPGGLDRAGYALEVAEHSLRFLAGYFGIPFPAGKLDHIAVPDFAAGAMENVGAVTYRENYLLADRQSAATADLQTIAHVVAHETAHMWFGNLVTMKWWNGIWLNEAFATFMEVTTADAYRPDWQLWAAFNDGRAVALATDGLRATRPVEYPVRRPEEAEGMFDVLTYQKGGAVLKMLERYLGEEVFRKGISHYLARHSFGNAETADLWNAIEEVSGEPVRTIMDSWIGQAGYPIVSVTLDEPGTAVVLGQDRFLYDGSTGHPERWSVPVNLRASVGGEVRRERLLLTGDEERIDLGGPVDWVVVNDGAWGFYRVDYGRDQWSRLLRAGPTRILDPVERSQLVGDVWAAVVAGRTPLGRWAEAAVAVAGPDPEPWAPLAGALVGLSRLGGDDAEAAATFARRLAEPVWAELGWDRRAGEDDRAAIARARVLRVLVEAGHHPEVAAEARRRLTAHLSGEGARLEPDLVGAAALAMVAGAGAEGWRLVRNGYLECTDPQEQLRLLAALGATPDPDLARETLELAVSGDVRSQNAHFVVVSVLSNPAVWAEGWQWLEQSWDQVRERLPSPLLVRVLEPAASLTDAGLAESVRRLVADHQIPVAPIRIQQILERMDVTVAMSARLRGTLRPAIG